jgi:hypothetical protein
MHKTPGRSDNHETAVVGCVPDLSACNDKLRRGPAGGGGVVGYAEHFERWIHRRNDHDLLSAG